MKKLFGASKKEEPKPPGPTLNESSAKVNKLLLFLVRRTWQGYSSQS